MLTFVKKKKKKKKLNSHDSCRMCQEHRHFSFHLLNVDLLDAGVLQQTKKKKKKKKERKKEKKRKKKEDTHTFCAIFIFSDLKVFKKLFFIYFSLT